jgi:hypothetical protein
MRCSQGASVPERRCTAEVSVSVGRDDQAHATVAACRWQLVVVGATGGATRSERLRQSLWGGASVVPSRSGGWLKDLQARGPAGRGVEIVARSVGIREPGVAPPSVSIVAASSEEVFDVARFGRTFTPVHFR